MRAKPEALATRGLIPPPPQYWTAVALQAVDREQRRIGDTRPVTEILAEIFKPFATESGS